MPIARHDADPPSGWPEGVTYLTRSQLSPVFPATLLPFLFKDPRVSLFQPKPTDHPPHLAIKRITWPSHPACGQHGLFTKKKLAGLTLILPYLGIIHATFIPAESDQPGDAEDDGGVNDPHAKSDYDLCLARISAYDERNPFPWKHVSLGVDASTAGNAGRFVNDYRGIASEPNAEFRLGNGDSGELRMEIWTLKKSIAKGEEILVSYGKGFWAARRDAGT